MRWVVVVVAISAGCTGRGPVAGGTRPAAEFVGSSPTVEELAAGAFHTCARIRGGTVRCWGMGTSGQLGDGARADRERPTKVPGLQDVVQIAAEGERSCAVRRDGSVWCWGRPGPGEPEETQIRARPVQVAAWREVRQIALGVDHDCAVTREGRVLCLGRREHGAIGDGGVAATAREPQPVVRLGAAVEVAVGYAFSCARGPDREVWCWGRNDVGQCGEPSGRDHLTPVRVPGVSGAQQLVAGFDHACALVGDGTARCWGGDAFGQRGAGDADRDGAPTMVVGLPVPVALAAGQFRSAAILADGLAVGWGRDLDGEASLWRGCADPRQHVSEGLRAAVWVRGPAEPYCPTPARLRAAHGVVQVVTGQLHACVRTDEGAVWCWGSNASGGVGDGSEHERPQPVPVAW